MAASRPLGSPWPAGARELGVHTANDLTVGGLRLADLADRHGTPLYVLDETEVRTRARAYRSALPDASIHYAAKAFLCGAMADWVRDEGLGLDVCSENELALALAHGFPAARIILLGHSFVGGNESHYRFTYWGWHRRFELLDRAKESA